VLVAQLVHAEEESLITRVSSGEWLSVLVLLSIVVRLARRVPKLCPRAMSELSW
jgi:hypothetical protein